MQGVVRYSVNAVRVFESAARCGSMLLAAEELGVTPGAVSHQIRGLKTRSASASSTAATIRSA